MKSADLEFNSATLHSLPLSLAVFRQIVSVLLLEILTREPIVYQSVAENSPQQIPFIRLFQ